MGIEGRDVAGSDADSGQAAPRVIVMTGATAGIGEAAVKLLAAQPDSQILVGARGSGRVVPDGVRVLPLDLASLAGVRAFADAVIAELAGAPIDALVLNAGLQSRRTDSRTVDGFETTFAVNHLAHYLLARLLAPYVRPGGRITVTTSDTHDPAVVPFGPRRLDVESLAHPAPSRLPLGMRAYAASKLCNLLTARSLAACDDLREAGVSVAAYNPGLTAGTNLSGVGPRGQAVLERVVLPVVAVASRGNPAFVPGTTQRAGQVLADISVGRINPPDGQLYVSLVKSSVTFPEPSTVARDDAARDDLWRRSAVMVGLPTDLHRAAPTAPDAS